LIAGDSPAHPFSIAADDEDSLGYGEKLKGLIPHSESDEELAAIISPRWVLYVGDFKPFIATVAGS